jgi:hypothetical protein
MAYADHTIRRIRHIMWVAFSESHLISISLRSNFTIAKLAAHHAMH